MKNIFAVLLLMFSLSAFATPVDGTITYKLPNGELATRDVTLETPSRGQGEVILSGKTFTWKTTNFKSYEVSGKVTFMAIFDTKFMGQQSKLLFKGTYLKGSNKLIYAGNIFKMKKNKVNHLGLFDFSFNR
tara:strand:+ start:27 stop:419 length:393 start_codon:yes stop_codon:yes gene_type:complete